LGLDLLGARQGKVQGFHRVAEMLWAQVGVSGRHPDIPVAQNLGDGPQRYSRHGQVAGRVVAQVVEREVLESEALDKSRKSPGAHEWVTLGQDGRIGIKRAGEAVEEVIFTRFPRVQTAPAVPWLMISLLVLWDSQDL